MDTMVGVAQLAERRVVVADVAGSSPVTHPNEVLAVLAAGVPRGHVHDSHVSRSSNERFDDILAAVDRCRDYRIFLGSDDHWIANMAFDAILRNLAVIGEAVRALRDASI